MKKSILLFIVFSVFAAVVFGDDLELSYPGSLDYVPGEVIVKYKDSNQNSSVMRLMGVKGGSSNLDIQLKSNNLEVKEELDDSRNVVLVGINDDKTVEETIELLGDNPDIEYVEPNYIRYLHYMEDFDSDDPSKGELRGLQYISRVDAFNTYSGIIQDASQLGGSGKIVAVIDNGVNYNHSDLAGSMWDFENGKCNVDGVIVDCIHGYDFIHNTPTPLPNFSPHGTHVAGTIAAEMGNGTGIIGVNPYGKIVALKVGKGAELTSADEIRAINFAINNGIKIINASYGGSQASLAEKDAIMRFGQSGGLFVTAAGNGDINHNGLNLGISSEYPCKFDLDNIICVAAVDGSGNLAYYSNYGSTAVDIAAPGSNIYSAVVKSATSGMIYTQNFTSCDQSGQVLDSWGSGSCYHRQKSGGYGYSFSGSTQSPIIDVNTWVSNIENRKDIYLSFSVSCDGAEVNIQYMSGDDISDGINLGYVPSSGSKFSLSVPEDYFSDQFRFVLSASSGRLCAIDDVTILLEPYVDYDNYSYGVEHGTSMATPHVAGLASLLWMVNPSLTNLDVKEFILNYGDDNSDLTGKLLYGKTINVFRSLEAVIKDKIGTPTGLVSSWTGAIQWEASQGAESYHYEVFDENEAVVLSGDITGTGLETGLTGNYSWKVWGIDSYGNKSDFGLSYICEKPNLQDVVLNGEECNQINGNLGVEDNCVGMYDVIWLNDSNEEASGNITTTTIGNLLMTAYIQNPFGEQTEPVNVNYAWRDTQPSVTRNRYKYNYTIRSTASKSIGNVLDLFGVIDGACGNSKIVVDSYECNKGEVSLNSNVLSVSAPSSSQGSAECLLIFKDDEGSSVEGTLVYDYNTLPINNGALGGGGGGGSGGGNTNTSTQNTSDKDQHNVAEENDIKKTNTGKQEILEKPILRELFENKQETKKDKIDFSWFNKSNPSQVLNNGYTVEFNNAFQFAHKMGITTTNSINEANMGGKLTRIAMAKMLSQYAINVLGKKPNTRKYPSFGDVSKSLDRDYDNGVTLAYQLGIMGLNMPNNEFRPNDNVTRGEFATALSRMLYGLSDGNPYYSTHINKLHSEGVITNSDPKIKEMRGYVMIMLMRSAMK